MIPAYKLYGAPLSLYTGKARAYLRFRNVPFIEEFGSPEIFERVGQRIIPVLHTPDDVLVQDTTDIIDYIETRLDGASVYPEGPVQRLVALLFEVYGDEWLLMAAMHYRWRYNLEFILQEFGKVLRPDGSPEEQRELGEKISAPFRGSLPLLGITEATVAGVESDYETLLSRLDAHFATHTYTCSGRDRASATTA